MKLVSVTNGDAGHCEIERSRTGPAAQANAGGGQAVWASPPMRCSTTTTASCSPRSTSATNHPAHPRVESRHRARSASQRLPSRPPLYRHPDSGRGLHGDCPHGGAAGAASLTKNPVFDHRRGRLPEARCRSSPTSPWISSTYGRKKLDAFEADASQFYEAQPCSADITAEVPKSCGGSGASGWRSGAVRRPRPRCGRRSRNGRRGARKAAWSTRKHSSSASTCGKPPHSGAAAPALPLLRRTGLASGAGCSSGGVRQRKLALICIG